MKKILLSASLVFLSATFAWPQGTRTHNHILNINYIQLKEEMNYGLVFRGPGFSYTYNIRWSHDRSLVDYEALLGFSYIQTRKVPAGILHIVPAKLSYLYKGAHMSNLAAGPFLVADYNYHFYPDLQSGQSFWLTHFSIGGMLHYDLNINRQLFSFSLRTSLFGFTSRQPEYHEPYFWDISTGDILKYFHQDLTFGSWNGYNFSELEIRWRPSSNSRFLLAYEIDYTGYFRAPKLTVLNQSLKLIIQPKSK
jgi:hypothetical protein